MHELSIAMSIIDVAEETAEQHGGGKVRSIRVRVGPLSGVVAEALQSAFTLAREGTGLDGAELVIDEVPLVIHCPACAAERTPESPFMLVCPVCGAETPTVVSGRELEVASLEIDSFTSQATEQT